MVSLAHMCMGALNVPVTRWNTCLAGIKAMLSVIVWASELVALKYIKTY